jgi:hypothetical protein
MRTMDVNHQQKDSHEPPGIREFHGLLRGLVKVPKTELDAEIKKDKARKKRRKKRR